MYSKYNTDTYITVKPRDQNEMIALSFQNFNFSHTSSLTPIVISTLCGIPYHQTHPTSFIRNTNVIATAPISPKQSTLGPIPS